MIPANLPFNMTCILQPTHNRYGNSHEFTRSFSGSNPERVPEFFSCSLQVQETTSFHIFPHFASSHPLLGGSATPLKNMSYRQLGWWQQPNINGKMRNSWQPVTTNQSTSVTSVLKAPAGTRFIRICAAWDPAGSLRDSPLVNPVVRCGSRRTSHGHGWCGPQDLTVTSPLNRPGWCRSRVSRKRSSST